MLAAESLLTLLGHDFERDSGVLQFDLVLKYVENKFEGLCRVEWLDALFKFVLLHHFEVEYVVDEANQKIDLGYHNQNNSALRLVISDR